MGKDPNLLEFFWGEGELCSTIAPPTGALLIRSEGSDIIVSCRVARFWSRESGVIVYPLGGVFSRRGGFGRILLILPLTRRFVIPYLCLL